jgi:spoIIIJ-associated protein
MEWVETTAKTVAEAKDLALDRLGVDEVDAEFDVLEEPRPGLFGRLRGEARVRARVRPAVPRAKVERRRGRKPVSASASTSPSASSPAERASLANDDAPVARSQGPKRSSQRRQEAIPVSENPNAEHGTNNDDGPPLVDEATAATSFLTGLVEALNVPASVSVVTVEDGELEARVEGGDLGLLIGPRGQTLQALQDLTRLAVQQQRGGVRGGWLRVDVSGYRAKRKDALERFTTQVVQQVLESGTPRSLEPMGAADRKIVHDMAGTVGGVVTSSEGEEPNRRVVISPANA